MKVLIYYGLLFFLSTAYTQAKPALKQPSSVSIMSFNVENLFDTKHDEGKNDWDYLPRVLKTTAEHRKRCESKRGWSKNFCLNVSWDESGLRKKMRQLAQVVLSVESGKGPDLLILQEVENLAVLKRWNQDYLKAAGYQSVVLLEGPDLRGIDVAMLSRLPLKGEAKAHPVKFVKANLNRPTRPILEARFQLPDGTTLAAFGVHFPSPFNPFLARQEAFQILERISNQVIADVETAIAAGDFNVNAGEDSRFYRQLAHPSFTVSHLFGCMTCLGTKYYKPKDTWSFFDAILLHKKSQWQIRPGSVEVIQHPSHVQKSGSPFRYRYEDGLGVSDHFPIMLHLERHKK
ncbi:endonuclease/exonuclease/phosphatase family protein [Pseudobacteriovorax antillogorgiicola]|uniref:Endonuclease/Exonuclease/phosphatase family protein n=1 Tax=Pseudobacteriovorax antillogorgiicola TaxID=1513793 RepID=A0A1Y6BPU4_9BACT|nr:endonuclease/exonuclease/phosphatase family protein [Pseudobacteriovorax antillogorgiicola]TCS53885.1 hypothetical protein EDD56_107194 [Pseudobacteriovorax antillogorgiicola]SMF21018.1 Endonuclease/Exonuclease/phosphatase family protein [Pseudobacteriovorax antillogorgiicola]